MRRLSSSPSRPAGRSRPRRSGRRRPGSSGFDARAARRPPRARRRPLHARRPALARTGRVRFGRGRGRTDGGGARPERRGRPDPSRSRRRVGPSWRIGTRGGSSLGPGGDSHGRRVTRVRASRLEPGVARTVPRSGRDVRSGDRPASRGEPTSRSGGALTRNAPSRFAVAHRRSERLLACRGRGSWAIQLYHVQGNGWNDIGYNFLVDRFGTIYEGRFGGTERNVVGAHALGFNSGSVGIRCSGLRGTAPSGGAERSHASSRGLDSPTSTRLRSRSSPQEAEVRQRSVLALGVRPPTRAQRREPPVRAAERHRACERDRLLRQRRETTQMGTPLAGQALRSRRRRPCRRRRGGCGAGSASVDRT
jgi:hypothetical protein